MKKEVVKDIDRQIKLNNDYYTACISCYSLDGNAVIDNNYLKISNKCLKLSLSKINEIAFDKRGITFAFSDNDIFTLNLQGSYINGINRIEFEVGGDLEPYKTKEEQEDGDGILFKLFDSLELETRNKFGKTLDWNCSIRKSQRYKDNKFWERKPSFFD